MADVKAITALFEELRRERQQLDDLWDNVADLTLPRHRGFTSERTPGEETRNRIVDPTAERANIAFASMLGGQVINPELQWFNLRFMDPLLNTDDEAVAWLVQVRDTINRVLNAREARFHQRANEIFLELGAFGTGVFFVEEANGPIPMRFAAVPLNEIFLAEDHAGNVDTVFRARKLNRRQFVQEFGEDNIPPKLARIWQREPQSRQEIIHVVMPNAEHEPGKILSPEGMPWASAHISTMDKAVIREGGFREFPYMVARWVVAIDGPYGRGPGVTALPDNRMLQRIQETTIRALQKAIDPPLQAPDDGFLGPIITTPSGINFFRAGSRDRIEPIDTGSNPQIGEAFSERVRENITQAFFIDLSLLDEPEPRVAATAILDRRDERFRRMVPMITRVQADFLAPLIDRVFGVLERAGALPEAPEQLADAEIDVEFVSPAALAQQASEADNITRFLERIFPLMELEPTAADKIDVDATIDVMQRMLNATPEIVRSEEEVAEIREQRAQAQQQQQALQTAEQGVGIVEGLANATAAAGGGASA